MFIAHFSTISQVKNNRTDYCEKLLLLCLSRLLLLYLAKALVDDVAGVGGTGVLGRAFLGTGLSLIPGAGLRFLPTKKLNCIFVCHGE